MIAYKGFNKDMTCTMGKGTFQYEMGVWYKENEANCARNGFHCVEEPLEVLDWYKNGRYCLVEIKGDIHEDGTGTKIAATEIRLVKELSLNDLFIHECNFIMEHPDRKLKYAVQKDKGTAVNKNIIVRGRNPKARGTKGSILFLLKEDKKGAIDEAAAIEIDGERYKENQYYGIEAALC